MSEQATDIGARNRRLLLAKQLHNHALAHAGIGGGALDKMIAVHNFHNAVEVTLRAIALEHEVRVERELNIDFESLMNEVDRFPKFRQEDKRLPYRQELRKLNAVRNLVQHHAHEPEASTMDEWRVFSRRFLVRAFKQYFDVEFDGLSSSSLVQDPRLRQLLELPRGPAVILGRRRDFGGYAWDILFTAWNVVGRGVAEELRSAFAERGELLGETPARQVLEANTDGVSSATVSLIERTPAGIEFVIKLRFIECDERVGAAWIEQLRARIRGQGTVPAT